MGEDPLALCGRALDGRFRVDSFVAEGGFGYVYRGVSLGDGREVALKFLKMHELDTDEMRAVVTEQFRAEAAVGERLSHPAAVPVVGHGVTTAARGEAPWVAFEWVRGRSLEADLDARWKAPPRAPAEVLPLIRPVLEALAEAHASGIAHRDLKPGNLMLTDAADGELPMRLLDFGISKVLLQEEKHLPTGMTVTRSAVVACSPDYAAPEQVSAGRTGPWTDVHQIALVLTEMLTHKRPYSGESVMALRTQAIAPERPTPGRHGVDVGAWEAVLEKALAIRPADRYPDAGALLAALDEALRPATTAGVPARGEAHAVVPERAPVTPTATARWLPAAVAVVLGLVALVMILLSVWRG